MIDQALFGNRELKILDEAVQIARNEILARQGAYLPFVTVGAGAGLDRPSLLHLREPLRANLPIPPARTFPIRYQISY